MSKHGTPLSPGQQEAFVGAVLRAGIAISHEIDPTTADGWARNVDGLKRIFRRELMSPATEGKCWKTLGPTSIVVDLSVDHKELFDGTNIVSHTSGKAVLEKGKIDGHLFIDGRKLALFATKRMVGTKEVRDYELREELTGKQVLDPNVMRAIVENKHLIPEDWEKKED